MPKKNSEKNQPERLWLAELEARVDALDDLADSQVGLLNLHGEMLQLLGNATIETLRGDKRLEAQLSTFWGRLMWLVRG